MQLSEYQHCYGILQKSWQRGVGIVALFSAHQILGGHLAPTVSNSIFLSLFALGMSLSRRSALPLINWLVGYGAAVVFLLPLLVPMLEGFSTATARAASRSRTCRPTNSRGRFPIRVLLGTALWLLHPHQHPYTTYTLAFGASAAAWCILPALASRARWRGLEVVSLVHDDIRRRSDHPPVVITEIMLHLPLFRSMRWPFREFVQFQFFLHLFLLVRPPGLTRRRGGSRSRSGSIVLVIPLVMLPLPPTFNAMTWDRELILTGGTERYWAQVRPLLKPDDRIAVLIPMEIYTDDRFEEPYSLLGTYNYAVLGGVMNAWGYSPTAPRDQMYTRTYAYYPFGAYRARAESRPDRRAARPQVHTLEVAAPAPHHAQLHGWPDHRPDALRPAPHSRDLAAPRTSSLLASPSVLVYRAT